MLVLTVDIGTTNIKSGVINEKGEILSFAIEEQKILRPERGAAEHNPEKLYNSFINLIRKVSKNYKNDISLLALSSYQFGFLPVDEKGNPLMGMMTLLDTRPKKYMKEVYSLDVKDIYYRTGCPPIFIYNIPRFLWLKKEKKEIFKRAKYFLGSKDFIISKILGKPFTEPSISSATQLMNINTLRWDEKILEIIEVGKEKLPELVKGEEILDELPDKVKDEMGLKGKVLFLPGVYDGGAVAIGVGGVGEMKEAGNLGTSAMLRATSSSPIMDKYGMRFQTYYLMGNIWLTGGAINNAGVSLKWVRDQIGKDTLKFKNPYETLISEAEKVLPGSENLYFLPYLTGERDPRIGNESSGEILGLKNFHTRGHIVRACLEGVGYSLRLLEDALKENNIKSEEIRMGGGGSKSSLWMRILSSILEKPITTSEVEESALLGIGILGFTALKYYNSIEEAIEKMVSFGKKWKPDKELKSLYNKNYKKFLSYLTISKKIWV